MLNPQSSWQPAYSQCRGSAVPAEVQVVMGQLYRWQKVAEPCSFVWNDANCLADLVREIQDRFLLANLYDFSGCVS